MNSQVLCYIKIYQVTDISSKWDNLCYWSCNEKIETRRWTLIIH